MEFLISALSRPIIHGGNLLCPGNLIAVLLCLATAVPAVAQKADKRLAESAAVLKTITTKKEISNIAWSKTKCVLIYPSVKKVGIGIGVNYGRGVLVCRTGANMDGKWGARPSCIPLILVAWRVSLAHNMSGVFSK